MRTTVKSSSFQYSAVNRWRPSVLRIAILQTSLVLQSPFRLITEPSFKFTIRFGCCKTSRTSTSRASIKTIYPSNLECALSKMGVQRPGVPGPASFSLPNQNRISFFEAMNEVVIISSLFNISLCLFVSHYCPLSAGMYVHSREYVRS